MYHPRTEVVTVWGLADAKSAARSPTLRGPSRGELGTSRVPSISQTSGLRASTFSFCIRCNIPVAVLRIRSISHIILELLGVKTD